jgi:hypothetical protein
MRIRAFREVVAFSGDISPALEDFMGFAEVPDGVVYGVVLRAAAKLGELQAMFPAFGIGKSGERNPGPEETEERDRFEQVHG